MKKLFSIFFMALGVIFFVLILFSVYLYVVDPFNLKPLFTDGASVAPIAAEAATNLVATSSAVVDKNPALSPSQEATLESFGINPAAVPSNISSEQEACFEAALGVSRVTEIKAGAAPTATDLFKARSCLQ
ncbi:hypothetical protein KC902_03165 [Candidatus Kaiserbacteria bacterium]|nr:hypothetical protein [Candidatus Kaiserbacteria bacterium]